MDVGIAMLLGIAALMVVARLMAGTFDKDRVRRYVESRGGRLESMEWNPWGRGWFGEKNDRIYEIRYVDAEGNRRAATCKTSIWSGVYLTEDRVFQAREAPGPPATEAAEVEQLRDEVARLRAEVERLKR